MTSQATRVWPAVFTVATLAGASSGIVCLIKPGDWLWSLVWLEALLAVAVVVPMLLARRHLAIGRTATLVLGAFTLVSVTGHRVARPQMLWSFVPTPAALSTIDAQMRHGIAAISTTVRPVTNADFFLALVLVALGLLTFIGLILGVVANQPVWVGLPALAAWLVFLTAEPGQSPVAPGLTALAFLLLVATGYGRRRAYLGRTAVVAFSTAVDRKSVV